MEVTGDKTEQRMRQHLISQRTVTVVFLLFFFFTSTAQNVKNVNVNTLPQDEIEKAQKAMIDAGITLIQYREKEKTMLEKYRQCEVLRKLTKDAGVTFIVNDHVGLAMAMEARCYTGRRTDPKFCPSGREPVSMAAGIFIFLILLLV